MPRKIAVLLAAGSGKRMGAPRPKQYLMVEGRTVLEHTVEVFLRTAVIDEICIVVHADYACEVAHLMARFTTPHSPSAAEQKPFPAEGLLLRGAAKPIRLILGGAERTDSTLNALRVYASEGEAHLLFHDAVRAAVSESLITAVAQSLDHHEAVNTLLPCVDTIVQLDSCGRMQSVPNRAQLRRVQTPQGFWCSTLQKAYALALADPDFTATDDCTVVLRYLPAVEIALVEGEEQNLKLTYPEDFDRLAHYLRQRQQATS